MKPNLTMLLAGVRNRDPEPIHVPPVPIPTAGRPWPTPPQLPYGPGPPGLVHLAPWLVFVPSEGGETRSHSRLAEGDTGGALERA